MGTSIGTLRLFFWRVLFCCAFSCVAVGQNLADWTLNAPANSLQLVDVKPFTVDTLEFTFRNISGKTILEMRVSAPNGNMTGVDGFTTGKGTVPPGSTTTATFGQSAFTSEGSVNRSLVIEAVVYTDGTRVGSTNTLALIEGEMLGAALETKRIATILTASPDPSADGFDAVLGKIRSIPILTNEQAASSVRGITLPGVPQSYIDSHVNRHAGDLSVGIDSARQIALLDINNTRSLASGPLPRFQAAQDAVQAARVQGVSDLAKKYRSLGMLHAQLLSAFAEGSNAH